MNAHWAGFSLMKVALKLLSLAHTYNEAFKYYHLFQGSDLPIKGNNEIHAYFEENYPTEYIDFNPKRYELAKYKHDYYHLFVENKYFRTNKFVKFLNHSIAKTQQLLHIKRKNNRQLFHGSAAISITDRFCDYILNDVDRITNEYRYTLACDEVLYQTEIMNSDFKDMVKYYGEQSKGEPSKGNARLVIGFNEENKKAPKELSKNDYDQLINLDRGIVFARKFVENKDFEIVEMIYDYVATINNKEMNLKHTNYNQYNDQYNTKRVVLFDS